MPDQDLAVLLSAALAAPGLGMGTLRLRAGLARGPFEIALAACRARGLLRPGQRGDNNPSRTRIFPTHLARDAAAGLQLRPGIHPADQEDAS